MTTAMLFISAMQVQHVACVLISTFLRGGITLEPPEYADRSNNDVYKNPGSPSQKLYDVPHRAMRLATSHAALGGPAKGLVHTLLPKLHPLLSLESQEIKAR